VKVEDTRFGTLDVPDDQLIEFPNGIIGFPASKRYVVLDHGEGDILRWLQSCDEPAIAFMILDPQPMVPDYPVDLAIKDAKDIGIAKDDEIALAAVVTIPPPPAVPTVNLMAPLVIGVEARKGKQVVFHDSPFHTRHPLTFEEPTPESDDPEADSSEAGTG